MKHSKASLFLMELILVLLFFSIASCICVQLFVKSGILSTKTKQLTYAVGMAQNTAEVFYATDGDMNAIATLYSDCPVTFDGPALSYSKDGYCCTLTVSSTEDNFLEGDIHITSLDNPSESIYSLSVKQYIAPGGASHGK